MERPGKSPRIAAFATIRELAIRHSAPIRALQMFAVRHNHSTRSGDERETGHLAGLGPKLHAVNLLMRPFGNTIYMMPPYCVIAGDLAEIYEASATLAIR